MHQRCQKYKEVPDDVVNGLELAQNKENDTNNVDCASSREKQKSFIGEGDQQGVVDKYAAGAHSNEDDQLDRIGRHFVEVRASYQRKKLCGRKKNYLEAIIVYAYMRIRCQQKRRASLR